VMAREKRQLHSQKSSWPWLLVGALVLVFSALGIVVGVVLSGKLKGDSDPAGQLAKNGKGGPGQGEIGVGNPKGDSGKGSPERKPGVNIGSLLGGKPKVEGIEDDGINSPLLELIKKNRVYLVLTKAGQSGFTQNAPVLNEDLHLGAFFKAIEAHHKDNNVKQSPDKFEAATYAMGPDPTQLRADRPIPYVSNGGTQARPVQYDLGPITALANALNPARRPAGIYFSFPRLEKRQWTHIEGKAIEPFYLVPMEVGRYPALVILTVTDGIEFDDETMTAGVKTEITEAIKKLIKDSNFPTKTMLRAGAPLATWGLAHVNTGETIDFKKAHLEPQKAVANLKGNNPNLAQYEKWTNEAISHYFPAAQAVAEAKKRNDILKALEKTAAYTEMSLRFVKGGSSIAGLDKHKEELTRDAVEIVQGRMTIQVARKKWEAKMKEMKVAGAKAEAAKWDEKEHQQAEWERFKKHQVFYLAGSMGIGNRAVVPFVQFNQ
tara:strand:- start:3594 stop:5063 length:1470 start_codon:yes stop_codon:yes gene_type:complete